MNISFHVPGIPLSKGSYRAIVRGRRAVMIPSNARSATWQAAIRLAAAQVYSGKPIEKPQVVRLSVRASFPRPKHASSATRKFHCVKPDADKLLRAVLDALTGVLYVDDCQVDSVKMIKTYDEPHGLSVEAWAP